MVFERNNHLLASPLLTLDPVDENKSEAFLTNPLPFVIFVELPIMFGKLF
jgi:hypothetical protein